MVDDSRNLANSNVDGSIINNIQNIITSNT